MRDKPIRPARARFSLGAVLFCVAGTILTLMAAWHLRSEWRETWRREAFLPQLETAAEKDPADARLLSLLGARYAEAALFDKAAKTLQAAVGAGERDPQVWLTWAAALAADSKIGEARAALAYGVSSGKCTPNGPLREALRRLDDAGAVTPLETLPAAQVAQLISPEGPGHTAVAYARGGVFNLLSDQQARRSPQQGGFTFRQREAEQNPDDVAAQLRWIEALRQNRRLRDAEQAAQRLLVRRPKSAEASLALADILYEGGAVTKAGLQYKQTLFLRPDWPPALLGLGKVALDKKLYRLAIETYDRAVQVAPENANAWIGRGRAYFNQSFRYDEALKSFEKAAALAPDRTDFFPYFSDALQGNYRSDEAETLLRRRLADAPRDARTQYLLANLLTDNKATPERVAEAERLYRSSLEIEPNAPVVRVRLARLLLDKNDPQAAADAGILLADAIEASPRDALAMRLMAQAYRRIGRTDAADAAQKRADELAAYSARVTQWEDREIADPRDLQVHEELAKLYEAGGETEKARRQRDMIYMLKNYPEQAQRGVTALMEATSKLQPKR